VSLPGDADVVVVRGYWWDEVTGAGVKASNGNPATVKFDPVSLSGASVTPNLRDVGSRGHIKTRTKTATVDATTGYFAALLVANDDPDLDAYGGRRVTFQGEPPFVIQVPYNAASVTVDAPMATATGLTVGATTKAVWLSDAAVIGNPLPAPPTAYLTSAQTLSLISDLEARVAALEGP
jgi:hypothetical protein